jgi:DNA (cytosine-5)-methyltransferase 1
MTAPFTFYEFFAGGGMARAGLGEGWRCLYANDFDAVKAETYRANWGGDDLQVGNVWALPADRLPGTADLAWASSPCQDVSLAGNRAGLSGARSSAFWGFWRAIQALGREGRAPRVVVIENVVGLLNSHGGEDFTALCRALADEGYRFGALESDAAWFTPQSRPRMFVIAARTEAPAGRPDPALHGVRVTVAFDRLPDDLKARWMWWRAPAPPARNTDLKSVLEPDDQVVWHTPAKTAALLALLSPLHQAKLQAMRGEGRAVGAIFRRTRVENGRKVQRAEVRFDGLAGCLRTPRGGSSRQFVVVLDGAAVRTRLLTPRECARLMGLPDEYRLPVGATQALQVLGDGVAAPVVRWLAAGILEPLLSSRPQAAMAAE